MRDQVVELRVISNIVVDSKGVPGERRREGRSGAGIKRPRGIAGILERYIQKQPGSPSENCKGSNQRRTPQAVIS